MFNINVIRSCLYFLSFFIQFVSLAQNFRCERVSVHEVVRLDSLPISVSSLVINPFIPYDFNQEQGVISFREKGTIDSVEVCFRIVSPKLFEPRYNRPIETYSYERGNSASSVRRSTTAANLARDELFALEGINSYGAITRGITVGNRQNLFVNSSLNLQLDGQVTDDLWVSAVITDQNIPYQPEGNTQQIRDFDNVFIKFYNENVEIVAGDVVLQNPIENGYFLKYYKNVQGINGNYRYKAGDNWQGSSHFAGAIAKGQFASKVVTPVEGVQGPYKLRGSNGERFVIVLANSEKVYLDGRLLQRGFDRDYVMDYNLGELTFSNRIVITRFSRIRVDYEYADQYYARSNINAVQHLKNDHLDLYFNYYREKDNARSTLGFDPDESDLIALRAGGDQNGLARISGIDSVGYTENTIQYARVDTVDQDGNNTAIYRYSVNEEEAVYRMSFSEVGKGNGDYVLASTTANGRVYRWVGPVNGVSQGNFAPVREVPTPNQKQLMVVGSALKLSDYETVYQEIALSTFDQNLYSKVDDSDNQAYAWKGGFRSEGRPVSFWEGYKLNSAIDFEYDHQNFQYIDRFRSVDYDRDWGYDAFTDTLKRQDKIFNSSVLLRKDGQNKLSYTFRAREKQGAVAGTQHELGLAKELGFLHLNSSNFYMTNKSGTFHSSWLRLSETLRFIPFRWTPGYTFTLDQNRRMLGDSVSSTLMHFTSHNFFIETPDTTRTSFRVDYIQRNDQLPLAGKMKEYTNAQEFRVGFVGRYFKTHRILLDLNYRKVHELIGERETDKNLLGKVSWSGEMLGGALRHSVSYTTANTRELRREFIFVQVATGEGTHTWRDANQDGIQDLNEFYEAVNPDEKSYIKLFTPTDEYIDAFQSTFIHTLDARFPVTTGSTGFTKWLSRWSFNSNSRFNYKTTDHRLGDRLVPFGQHLESDNLLLYRSNLRNTLFFNRNGSGLGVDLSQSTQRSKSLLAGGYEINEKEDGLGAVRVTLGSLLTIRSHIGLGRTVNSSDFLSGRNYRLNRNKGTLEVVWQPANTFRLVSGVERRYKGTEDSELEGNSVIQEYRLESTWVRTSKGNLNATFSWLQIDFEGQEDTLLGYELLEALKPGSNQRWRLNWQQTIKKGLQLSVQYNGRKSTDSQPVHTGSVQVTAYF